MSLRYRTLVPSLLLFAALAAPAFGGIPVPENSTVPPCLVACPGGDITYTVVVRDIASNPVVGCDVRLSFGACPTFRMCPECCTGLVIDWQNRNVTAVSDVNGVAHFPLEMGGTCPGATVGAYACNVYLGSAQLASPDQDGNHGVDGVDATIVFSLLGTTNPGADFDCDGVVTQADLDWLNINHLGHHCSDYTPTRATTWGTVKIIYR